MVKAVKQKMQLFQRPFPPEIPQLMRSGWMCGAENSGGVLLPKICCPTAALPAKGEEKEEPPAHAHPFSAHPNIKNVAGLADCGRTTVQGRIVGGQVRSGPAFQLAIK